MQHRVEGLAQRAATVGVVSAPPPADADIEHAWLAALRRSLEAEWWAYETITTLNAAAVDALALKGIAIAHLDHDDPCQRVFGDADIMIRRSDYDRAMNVLLAAGFQRVEPPVRVWWERRFSKAIMLRTPTGGELDLHLALTGGYFGARVDHARLWAAPHDRFDLGGIDVHALNREGRWLHACYHAVLGGGSGLRALRDVAQLLLIGGLNWQRAVDHAAADGTDAVIATAVRMTWEQLTLDPSHPAAEWAAAHAPDDAQRAALTRYQSASQTGWGPEGWSILPALGVVDRVRFLVGIAAPSGTNLRYRGRSRWAHTRTIMAMLRRVLTTRATG